MRSAQALVSGFAENTGFNPVRTGKHSKNVRGHYPREPVNDAVSRIVWHAGEINEVFLCGKDQNFFAETSDALTRPGKRVSCNKCQQILTKQGREDLIVSYGPVD
jgi:hypothetical protein